MGVQDIKDQVVDVLSIKITTNWSASPSDAKLEGPSQDPFNPNDGSARRAKAKGAQACARKPEEVKSYRLLGESCSSRVEL